MDSVQFDEEAYVSLLEKLIGESKFLQNNPPDQIPMEDRAVRHILEVLEPFSADNGGPLVIQHVSFVEGRGNLIIEYPGSSENCVSIVGSHLDVVSANPESWDMDPFKMTRDGDKLYGRGTTDCLGHAAILTTLMAELGRHRPPLKNTIVAVMIANEENAKELGVGVDELVKRGMLDHIKSGPVYWLDTADSQPCLGTAGMMVWKLKATGRLFHSGFPTQGINSMELAMEAVSELQRRFYETYPESENDKRYKFECSSSMKPTRWDAPPGTINIIPGECSISGDIRLSPFHCCKEVMAKLQAWVEDINANLDKLPTRSPQSKFDLRPAVDAKGKLEIEFAEEHVDGIAVDMNSEGFKTMMEAWDEVYGGSKPFSVTGSLPCVRELQDEGFDLNIIGFGCLKVYHANNEYALLSDMEKGFKLLGTLVSKLAGAGPAEEEPEAKKVKV
mmetsp:Transcript_8132/g.23335  ORF Transcript_8132/g.23335 Transcript_8132/m.23335 type:complete len:446 (-) Transcript_8132:440-1777(-)